VTGLELTEKQKALVANRWERAYNIAIEKELDNISESDRFRENVSDRQAGAVESAWDDLGPIARMNLVEGRSLPTTEGSDFAAASKALGTNAEGLTRAMSRVAQSYSKEGTVKAWVDNDGDVNISITALVDGEELSMDRIFSRNENGTLHAHHDVFILPESARAKGIAAQMLLESARVYERYGVADMSATANLSVGGYAWASLGFEASRPDSFRHTMVSRMISKGIDPDRRNELEAMMKAAGKDAPFALASHPLGKDIMIGSLWSAYLSLSGDTGRSYKARLVDKVGKKKGKA